MQNLYDTTIESPFFEKRLRSKDNLITLYNCPIRSKHTDVWSNENYIVYVVEGRKIWHTAHGSYDLTQGSCVFVRKGASIVEQFFDAVFCLVVFFVTDDFICDVLKSKTSPIYKAEEKFDPIINIESNAALKSFFNSMAPFFEKTPQPDQSLIELKFRELILTIADNHENSQLLSYFDLLLQGPQNVSIQNVMDNNYCFNLKLPQFARLSNRSLSAFKRDFQRHFDTTPGKWLIEKRLQHGKNLLANAGKTVSEAAFESGFENVSHFSRAFRQRFGANPASLK